MHSNFADPVSELSEKFPLTDHAVNSLSHLVRRTLQGSKAVFRSPFLQDMEPKDILDLFESEAQILDGTLDPDLEALEIRQRSKFGPRSIAKPWTERREGVLDYFAPDTASGIRPSWKPNLPFNRLRPVSLDTALAKLKKKTNSGLPWMRPKGEVLGEIEDAFNNGDFDYPAVLFTRTQEEGKTRTVFGFPGAVTLREIRYLIPMLTVMKSYFPRASLNGPESVDSSVDEIFERAREYDRHLVSIDFSAYDSTVRETLQSWFWDFMRELFQDEYATEISAMQDQFLNKGLFTPEGIFTGEHGIPSGSGFTQEVGSMVQLMIANRDDILVSSDDGLHDVEDPELLFHQFTSTGLDINQDKSYVSKDFAIYLQKYYSDSYRKHGRRVGVYPVYRALNRIIHPERWTDFDKMQIKGREYFALRMVSIMENVKHHPKHVALVKFVLKYDKYNLSYTSEGLEAYVNEMFQSSGTKDLFKNQYGEDLTGIESFDTIRLIRELS